MSVFTWSPSETNYNVLPLPEHVWDPTWTLSERWLACELMNMGYNRSIASMFIYKRRGLTYDNSQEQVLLLIEKRLSQSDGNIIKPSMAKKNTMV